MSVRCDQDHTMTLCLQIGFCICDPPPQRQMIRATARRRARMRRDMIALTWGVLIGIILGLLLA